MLTYFCWLVKTKMRKIHVSSNKLLKGDWTLSLEISEYVSSSWSDVEHGCHIFLLLICSLSDLEFRFTFWGFTFWLVLFWGCLLWLTEKAMAPHSSTLAWKISWTEEPGRLQSMGLLRVGHDWVTSLSLFTVMEKEMATHSSVLAWRIPGMAEPGGLPSMRSHRVRHDWSDLAAAANSSFEIPDLSFCTTPNSPLTYPCNCL